MRSNESQYIARFFSLSNENYCGSIAEIYSPTRIDAT